MGGVYLWLVGFQRRKINLSPRLTEPSIIDHPIYQIPPSRPPSMPTQTDKKKKVAVARWVDDTKNHAPTNPFQPLPFIPEEDYRYASPGHERNPYAAAFYKSSASEYGAPSSPKSEVSSAHWSTAAAPTIKPKRRSSIKSTATVRTVDSIATQYSPTQAGGSIYEPSLRTGHHHTSRHNHHQVAVPAPWPSNAVANQPSWAWPPAHGQAYFAPSPQEMMRTAAAPPQMGYPFPFPMPTYLSQEGHAGNLAGGWQQPVWGEKHRRTDRPHGYRH
ncbi:hypothetical protein HGRIS_011894 [Hohenbuehelia grisea]|uniref:Uncharacterized protein n=1 Tax=Hohenbuehelia grisea TaxID=104357 RepID=A0ABR3JXC6_9AGAR